MYENGVAYDQVMAWVDRLGLSRLRRDLVADLHGDVLEIGIGTGRSMVYYPKDVHLTGLEPSLEMAQRLPTGRIQFVEGQAESLPFPDAAFDGVVFSLVLCSVADLTLSLQEAKRVLRPGGRLHLLEHVRHSGFIGKGQDALAPFWAKSFSGCRLNQDKKSIQERLHGFTVIDEEVFLGFLYLYKLRKI